MKRTSKRVMAVAVSLAMVLTGSTSALAATTNPDITDREIEHKTAAKNIAAQGMVLLENENNSLPISKEKGTKVALFGQGVYNTIKGGTGSGAVNQRDNVTVQQGFENASVSQLGLPSGKWLEELTDRKDISFDERVVVMLALMPHIKPQALDTFFLQNGTLDRQFTQFGGWKGLSHGGFLPTGETAAFIIAGDDTIKRCDVVRMFQRNH